MWVCPQILPVVPALRGGGLPQTDRSRGEPPLDRQKLPRQQQPTLFFVNNNFVARAVKQKAASIDRHSLAAKRKEIVSGSRACPNASALLECLLAAHHKAKATWRCSPEPCCLSRVGRRNALPGRQNSQGVLNSSKNSTTAGCSASLAMTPIISDKRRQNRLVILKAYWISYFCAFLLCSSDRCVVT